MAANARVLCVTDAHGSDAALVALEKFLAEQKPDLVFMAGDFTHRGKPEDYAQKFLAAIEKAGAPVFAVHGNMDSPEVKGLIEKMGVSIHAKKVNWKGFEFAGLGGGPKSVLSTLIEYENDEQRDLLKGIIGPETIVLSHAPPYGTKADDIGNGIHIGMPALREAVEKIQPRAVICGHAHENQCVERIGKTIIIKVPALKDGKAALVELPSLKTTFLE